MLTLSNSGDPTLVMTSHQSINIANSNPFRRWVLLQLCLANAPEIYLHICLSTHIIRLLLFKFIYYICFIIFFWSILTYGIHCLFIIIFCSRDYSYFYYVYIVIVIILNHNYNVHLTSFSDYHISPPYKHLLL